MKDIVLSPISLSELMAEFSQVLDAKLKEFPLLNLSESNPTSNEYATRKEVADRLRISLPTLNTLTKDEVVKGYRIGGRVLYKWCEVEAVLTEISTTKYKRKNFIKQ